MCSKPSPTHEGPTHETATLDEFEADLDQFGGDLGHWPSERRLRAEQLMAVSPAAREALADARLVDEFLAARPSAPSDNGLAERIFARQRAVDAATASTEVQGGAASVWTFGLRQVALYAAVGIVGLASGWLVMPAQTVYDVSGVFMLCTDVFYL